MNSSIVGDRWQLALTADARSVSRGEADAVVTAYLAEVRAVIAHCVARSTPERTPADFTGGGLDLDAYDRLLTAHGIPADVVEDVYPLTALQQGLLVERLRTPASPAYH